MPIKKKTKRKIKAKKKDSTKQVLCSELKTIKDTFLQILHSSASIKEALEEANLEKGIFNQMLFEDKKFKQQFDDIINQKLELALLDSALRASSSTILTFSLTNRMPDKYKGRNTITPESVMPQQIVYVQEKEDKK